MTTSVTIYLHHHGDFTSPPNMEYVGGRVDVISDFDTDLLSFRDLEDFAEKYDYNSNCIVCFKTDGQTFEKGITVVYDDSTVRELVKLHNPYGKIDLYVDHFTLDDANETETARQGTDGGYETKGSGESEYSDDPDYDIETEDSDTGSLDTEHPETDEELEEIRKVKKNFEAKMKNAMRAANVPNLNTYVHFDESDFSSEGLWSDSSSSEDENARIGYVGPANPRKKRRRSGKHKLSSEGIKWEVGQKFGSMDEFRDTVRKYGIDERRPIQFVTNDKNRCQVACQGDCSFYIWCSRDKNSENCTIKTLVDEHLCTKPYSNKLATVKYLNEIYGDRVRKNPQWKIKEMIETIKVEMEIDVPRIKVLRVRKLALEGVHESLKEHYSKLRDFGHEIILSNPQNTVKISTTRLNETDKNKFKRIYLCYYALKAGWKAGCRPIIGLDGCFLKTVCGGQLLSAVGRDGNNQMFPIAYAVVESENTDSWRWFVDLLKDDLDLGDGRRFTIISDQQKGLENAIKEILPSVEHRFCTRHLYSNFRKRFASLMLRRAFWNAACATHPVVHAKAMKQMERLSKCAYEQLKQLDAKVWSKAFFATHSLADNIENNMSESFNAWIISERYMPLLTMMQEIHFKLLTRMRARREEMINSNLEVCPRIKKRIDVLVTESRMWTASWDGMKRFQVKSGTQAVRVDLEGRSCDCRVFDLTGIPCAHAIAAIHERRHNPINYLSDFYKRDKYLATYQHGLEAIKGEDYWEVHSTDELLPPDIPKKLRGRPKKQRRKEHWEGGNRSQNQTIPGGPVIQRYSNKRIMHCRVCRQPGHTKGKCPTKNNAEANDEETEMRGAENNRKNANKGPAKKKSAKELKRQKLQVRRQGKNVQKSAQEIQSNIEESQQHNGQQNEEQIQDNDQETQKNYKKIAEEGQERSPDPSSFLQAVPRRKLPILSREGTDEWEKSGRDYVDFQAKLRGTTGYKAIFMPTPGMLPYNPPRGTPPASTPPNHQQNYPIVQTQQSTTTISRKAATSTQQSSSSGVTKRATRLSKQKSAFKFFNTPDDPVDLAE